MLLFFGGKFLTVLNISLYYGIKSTKRWKNFTPMTLIGPMLLLIFENVSAYALIQDYALIRTLKVRWIHVIFVKKKMVRVNSRNFHTVFRLSAAETYSCMNKSKLLVWFSRTSQFLLLHSLIAWFFFLKFWACLHDIEKLSPTIKKGPFWQTFEVFLQVFQRM